MKKLFVSSLLLLSVMAALGQGAPPVANAVFSPKRVIKTNLLGYALLTVSANYEQKVGPQTSVGLLAGYKIPSVIHVDAIGELDGENQTYSGDVEPQGFFVNPYFRFYTGKAMTGFYLEAFARYYDYTYLVPYDYDKDGQIIHANLDGTASGMGGGLAIGVQLQLAPRIYLDINGGMGVASGDAHVETHDPNLDPEDYQTIKRNIEDYAEDADVRLMLLDKTISSLVAGADDNSAWADIENEIFPIVRGGIAIGFAF
ncbi:MAG: DUF3575 domain-containing protein [Flavobacteriales bacterium]